MCPTTHANLAVGGALRNGSTKHPPDTCLWLLKPAVLLPPLLPLLPRPPQLQGHLSRHCVPPAAALVALPPLAARRFSCRRCLHTAKTLSGSSACGAADQRRPAAPLGEAREAVGAAGEKEGGESGVVTGAA